MANDIAVRLTLARSDTDIAHDAIRALQLHSTIPTAVQAVVRNGSVSEGLSSNRSRNRPDKERGEIDGGWQDWSSCAER